MGLDNRECCRKPADTRCSPLPRFRRPWTYGPTKFLLKKVYCLYRNKVPFFSDIISRHSDTVGYLRFMRAFFGIIFLKVGQFRFIVRKLAIFITYNGSSYLTYGLYRLNVIA